MLFLSRSWPSLSIAPTKRLKTFLFYVSLEPDKDEDEEDAGGITVAGDTQCGFGALPILLARVNFVRAEGLHRKCWQTRSEDQLLIPLPLPMKETGEQQELR